MVKAKPERLPKPVIRTVGRASSPIRRPHESLQNLEALRGYLPRPPSPDSFDDQAPPQDPPSPLRDIPEPVLSEQQRRRAAEAEHWQSAREQLGSDLLSHTSQVTNSELAQSVQSSHRLAITTAAESAVCPDCGNKATEQLQQRAVLYIAFELAFEINIPIYSCRSAACGDCGIFDGCAAAAVNPAFVTCCCCRCCDRSRPFHATPGQCGAFPGSPVHAMSLTEAHGSQPVHWLATALLNHFLTLRSHCPTLAVDGFVQAVHEQHQQTSPGLLPCDTLRKVFGRASDEFSAVQLQHEQRVSQQIGINQSPLGHCIACNGMQEAGCESLLCDSAASQACHVSFNVSYVILMRRPSSLHLWGWMLQVPQAAPSRSSHKSCTCSSGPLHAR